MRVLLPDGMINLIAELQRLLRRARAARRGAARPGVRLAVEQCEQRELLSVSQWAGSVISFSSQRSPTDGAAVQALGAPNTPGYGDQPTAWSPALMNGSTEGIQLGYANPVYATGVTVRETSGNGFVTRIDVVDTNNVMHTVWTGTDPTQPGAPADFTVNFAQTPYQVAGVMVMIDTNHDLGSWEQIDAVRLDGEIASSPLSWTAAGDGVSWTDPLNWSADRLPTYLDDVSIGYGANVTLAAGSAATVKSLSNAGTLTVDGSLTLLADSSATGVLNVHGSLTLPNASTLTMTGGGELGGTVNLGGAGTRLEVPRGSVSLRPGLAVFGQGVIAFGSTEGEQPTALVLGEVTTTNLELRGGTLGGPGTLNVTTRMTWSGGMLANGLATRIRSGARLIATADSSIVQEGATLVNEAGGTVDWNGSAQMGGGWTLSDGAQIINAGLFNIITNPNRFSEFNQAAGAEQAVSIQNDGQIVVSGTGTAVIDLLNFTNAGTGRISVTGGRLKFDGVLNWLNTGYLEAAAGTSVIFSGNGVYTFDPNREDTSIDMMRGDGWFITELGAQLIIPQFASVDAGNFQLTEECTIAGAGTFRAHYLLWTGGTMGGPRDGETGSGVTLVDIGDRLIISGDVDLTTRELRNRGTVEWQPPSDALRLSSGAAIINDGGLFDVYTPLGSITNADLMAGKFIVTKNGLFRVNFAEAPLQITIGVAFENNGGRVIADGNVTFSGGYLQTGVQAEATFGMGTFTFTNTSKSLGGTFRLRGGYINTFGSGRQSNGSRDTRFELEGTMRASFWAIHCEISLTGDLYNSFRYDLEGCYTLLNGHELSSGYSSTNSDTATRQGVIKGPGSTPAMQNTGIRVGAMTIEGDYTLGANGLDLVGDEGQTATLTVEGDFIEEAGATISFQIGQGRHDLLTAAGHATLAGNLEVTLLDGYRPNPGDEFLVLTYASCEGAFANSTIDLGDGLYFEVRVGPQGVTLVTRSTI